MQTHLLITDNLKPIPEGIKVIFTRRIKIFELDENDKPTQKLIHGDNAIVEGSKEDIINWLKKYDEIWVGTGTPGHEQFHKDKISPELC